MQVEASPQFLAQLGQLVAAVRRELPGGGLGGLAAYWGAHAAPGAPAPPSGDGKVAPARALGRFLEEATRYAPWATALGRSLAGAPPETAELVLTWAAAVAGRDDVVLAPLLGAIDALVAPEARRRAALARLAGGPLADALAVLPACDVGLWADDPADPAAARLAILVWEAGEAVSSVPALGRLVAEDAGARWRLVERAARGTLLERAVAARLLAVGADGVHALEADAEDRLLGALRRLMTHPEPLVWIPAARALGRLAGRVPAARALLERWRTSARRSETRRAITALASLPAGGEAAPWLDAELDTLLADPDRWRLAAIGPALPYVQRERPEAWERLVEHLMSHEPPLEVLWSAAQGLLAGLRRAPRAGAYELGLLRVFRRRADEAAAGCKASTDAQLWHQLRAQLALGLGDEPAPAELPDLRHDRALHDALARPPRAASAAAAATVATAEPTPDAQLAATLAALDAPALSPWARGRLLASLEAIARAAVLGLDRALVVAGGGAASAPDAAALAWKLAPRLERDLEYGERRATTRALALFVDSAPVDREGGAGGPATRGRLAATAVGALARSPWWAELGRLPESKRAREVGRFQKAVSDLLWRAAEAASDGAYLALDDTPVTGLVLAWWALAHDGALLIAALEHEDGDPLLDATRRLGQALAAGAATPPEAGWAARALDALARLGVSEGAVAAAAARLFDRLGLLADEAAAGAAAPTPPRQALAELADAARGLAAALADLGGIAARAPGAASAPSAAGRADGTALVEALITGGLAADAFVAALAHGLSPPLARLIAAAALPRARALLAPRAPTAGEGAFIGPYACLERLGGGAQGEVFLVQRGARRFVLKRIRREIPPLEREQVAHSLGEEARRLAELSIAHVVPYHDHGVHEGTPYLVMGHLVGADLGRFTEARGGCLPTREVKRVVADVGGALVELHALGLVHRDLKPPNVFLRLPLPKDAGGRFDPGAHAALRISEAVLIDFGIATLAGARERGICGTPGYLPPEEARGLAPDPRSDVYGLAATLFHVWTGQILFAAADSMNQLIYLHGTEQPLDHDKATRAACARLPRGAEAILRPALDPELDRRPPTAEFVDALLALPEDA